MLLKGLKSDLGSFLLSGIEHDSSHFVYKWNSTYTGPELLKLTEYIPIYLHDKFKYAMVS